MLLIACDNSNDNSPLIGSWITVECGQVTTIDGSSINYWNRAIYEFTSAGTIKRGWQIFSDSNCTTQTKIQPPADISDFEVSYLDTGEIMLAEGIDGYSLTISFSSAVSSLSIDSFYSVNNNLLCFSDVFTFDVFEFGLYEGGASEIDFNSCLTRP